MIELAIFFEYSTADDGFQASLIVNKSPSPYQDKIYCKTTVNTLAIGLFAKKNNDQSNQLIKNLPILIKDWRKKSKDQGF